MTSQDDLALLKQMYQRGEISDEQYDVLRRHVLWGTPLPLLMDDVPGPRQEPPPAVPAPRADPDVPTYATPQAPRYSAASPDQGRHGPPAEGSRQARREAAQGSEPSGYTPSGYRPPTGSYPPPGGPAPPANGYQPTGGYPPPPPANGYEPGSRRARREAAENSAAPYPPPAGGYLPRPEAPRSRRVRREEQERSTPDDYSPSAYLPAAPESLPAAPESLPAAPESRTYPPPDDAPRSRRERREAAERSVLPPPPPFEDRRSDASHRADDYPAYVPATAADHPRAPAYGPPDTGRWPSENAPADLPMYPPDELQPRRARREAETPDADDSPRRRRKRDGDQPPADRGRSGATGTADQPAADRRKAGAPDQPVKARRRRSLLAVLTSVVLALALAAGGVWWFTLRQAGVLPAEYAKSICGSVRDWQQSVDSSNGTLVASIAREQDRTAVRAAVSAYYTGIAGRTDQLRITILDAGVADVAGGQAYSDSLAAAVGDEATGLRGLAARAGRFDPAAAATFQIELQSLLTGSETAVGNVSSALARPSAGTPTVLRAALSAEPSCAPYVG